MTQTYLADSARLPAAHLSSCQARPVGTLEVALTALAVQLMSWHLIAWGL